MIHVNLLIITYLFVFSVDANLNTTRSEAKFAWLLVCTNVDDGIIDGQLVLHSATIALSVATRKKI